MKTLKKFAAWLKGQVLFAMAWLKARCSKKETATVVNGHPDVADGGGEFPVTVSLSTARWAKWNRRCAIASTVMLAITAAAMLLVAKVEQGVIETQTRVIKKQQAELVAMKTRFERASRLVNEAQEAKGKWDFDRSKRLYRNAQLALTGK